MFMAVLWRIVEFGAYDNASLLHNYHSADFEIIPLPKSFFVKASESSSHTFMSPSYMFIKDSIVVPIIRT